MPSGVAALAGGSIVGGLFQGRAASQAADAQVDAANAAAAEQRRQYDLSRQDLAPYRHAGYGALAALQYELGLGERPTFNEAPEIMEIGGGSGGAGGQGSSWFFGDNIDLARGLIGTGGGGGIRPAPGSGFRNIGDGREYIIPGGGRVTVNSNADLQELQARYGGYGGRSQGGGSRFQVGDQVFDTRAAAEEYVNNLDSGFEYRGFQETPGYQYAMEQDQRGLERMAAARGMRLSGATLNEAGRRAQGRANQEYGTFVNRLAALSGTGQTAVNTGAQLGAQSASNIGNALMQGGQARASGYMGQANALTGTLNNLGGIAGAAYGGQFGPNPGFGITPSPAGLSAWGY